MPDWPKNNQKPIEKTENEDMITSPAIPDDEHITPADGTTSRVAEPSAVLKKTHLSTLRWAGTLLIVAGSIHVVAMLDSMLKAPKGFFNMNLCGIVPVVAGIFLFRGSLRVARAVGWVTAFVLPILVGCFLFQLVVPPFDFLLVLLRIAPRDFFNTLGWPLLKVACSAWLLWELRSQPVRQACLKSRKSVSRLCIPVLFGVLASIAVLTLFGLRLQGDTARQARRIAQQLGPKYKCWVDNVTVIHTPVGKMFCATVIAYNQREIRMVPVHWTESPLGDRTQTQGFGSPELPASGPETWNIAGKPYQIEGTAILNLSSGEVMSTVNVRCDFPPRIEDQPYARLVAKYAVEHGYRIQESKLNGRRQPVSDHLGVALVYRHGSDAPECHRYVFSISEIRAELREAERANAAIAQTE
jgi:hypothetical protein